MKNILIVNQPLNNRGDESAHKALVRRILTDMPSVNIKILFVGENNDSIEQFKIIDKRVKYISLLSYNLNYSNIKNKIYRRLIIDYSYFAFLSWCLYRDKTFLWNLNPIILKVKKIVKAADIVLCAPGGICMGGFQYWPHIAYLYMAKLLKKDIYYYGRSFGPFPVETEKNRRFRDISLELLKYFTYISIRDKKTQILANQLNINYHSTVDSAFLEIPKVTLPEELTWLSGEKYMVLVPNILIWHYGYHNIPKERIFNLFLEIIEIISKSKTDFKIIMLPQTFNYNNYIMDDINFFNELKEKSQNNRVIVLNDTYSSDIQQKIISNAKFLIGARYHSAVFAINNNIPFIALSYEHKISGLLTSLNGESNIVDISDLSQDAYINNILNQIKSKLDNLSSDSEINQKAKFIANNCFEQFIDLIK